MTSARRWLLIVVLLLPISSFAWNEDTQNDAFEPYLKQARELEQQGAYPEAIKLYLEFAKSHQRVAELSKQADDWDKVCDALSLAGWDLAVYQGAYEEAATHLGNAQALAKKHLPPDHSRHQTIMHNLAVIAYYRGHLDEALALNQTLLSKRREAYGNDSAHVAATLNNLGLVYRARGDWDQAYHYFNETLDIKKHLHKPQALTMASTYHNLGYVSSLLGKLDRALDFLNRAYEIRTQHLPEHHPSLGSTAYALGLVYFKRGEVSRAGEQLNKAARIQEQVIGRDSPHFAHTLQELARIKVLQGQPEQGLAHLLEAIAIFEKHLKPDDHHLAETHHILAWTYWHLGLYPRALEQINHSLALCHYPQDEASFINGTLLRGLLAKATMLVSQAAIGQEQAKLKEALRLLEDGARLLNRKQIQLLGEQAQLEWNRTHQHLLALGVDVAAALFQATGQEAYFDQAFSFSEQSKMAVFKQSFRLQSAATNSAYADVAAQERAHQDHIRRANARLREAHSLPGSHGAEVRGELIQAYQSFEAFLNDQHDTNPKYARFRFGGTPRPVTELVQLTQAREQTLIAYHLFEDVLTGFLIKGTTRHLFQSRWPNGAHILAGPGSRDWLDPASRHAQDDLSLDLDRWRSALIFDRSDATVFYGQKLARFLFGDISSQLGKTLLIIPDPALTAIPFEALPSLKLEDQEPETVPLIAKHAIRYAYSAEFLKGDAAQLKPAKLRSVGFAPTFSNASSISSDRPPTSGTPLAELAFTRREVETIAALFRKHDLAFEAFVDQDARKETFLKVIGQANHVHVASHASLTHSPAGFGKLFFEPSEKGKEPSELSVHEVYSQRTAIDLMVLSACDTALGPTVAGEGIIGFSRAWQLAGVRRLVVSLWPVKDQIGHDFFRLFYEAYLSGNSPEAALQMTKQQLRDQGKPASDWAPFVLIGGS